MLLISGCGGKSVLPQNTSAAGESSQSTSEANDSSKKTDESLIEVAGYDMWFYYDSLDRMKTSGYVAFKNTSEYCIEFRDARFDYVDENNKLLETDRYVHCIPEVIKPGQTGYMYSYYFDISGLEDAEGLHFIPDGSVYKVPEYYEIEISDVSLRKGKTLDISVIGRGTNNTGKDIAYAKPSAVFFDKNDEVIGFCYGLESFGAGQTKSFEISGDVASNDIDPEKVDHVEVFIQGRSKF